MPSGLKYMDCRFGGIGASQQNDATITSGTAGETNLITIDGIPFSYMVIGTQTTLIPAISQAGVDFTLTDTDGQGFALSPFSNSIQSPLCFTIGTDAAFFTQLTVQATDWSGVRLYVGFHGGSAATMEAHETTWANYTDKATIGNHTADAVDVYTSTALNDGADVDTDTTINLTDGDVMRAKVLVSAAGVATYGLDLAATATPTTFVAQSLTTVAYTFDDGDTVTPLVWCINAGDTVTALNFKRWLVAHQ